jgi:hypothetical protein
LLAVAVLAVRVVALAVFFITAQKHQKHQMALQLQLVQKLHTALLLVLEVQQVRTMALTQLVLGIQQLVVDMVLVAAVALLVVAAVQAVVKAEPLAVARTPTQQLELQAKEMLEEIVQTITTTEMAAVAVQALLVETVMAVGLLEAVVMVFSIL